MPWPRPPSEDPGGDPMHEECQAPMGCPRDCGEASGIAFVLGELRSEYYQIRKAEVLMQRHRDKWMRSVEQWLDHQARVMTLPADSPFVWGSPRKSRTTKRRKDTPVTSPPPRQLQLEAPQIAVQQVEAIKQPQAAQSQTETHQLGPQRPCEQPVPVQADELDVHFDSLQDLDSVEEVDNVTHGKKVQLGDEVEERIAGRTSVGNAAKPDTVSDALCQMSKEVEAYRKSTRRYKSSKKWKAMQHEHELEPWSTRWVVEHPLFDSTCAIMIVLNSVIIGLEVEHQAQGETTESPILKTAGYICNLFFLVELVLRVYVNGKKYFCNENRNWNLFDFALVIMSIVDIIIELGAGGGKTNVTTGMKTVKMLRIVRVFRVFRFFRELSLLALMIVDSTANLGWAIILLSLIIYVFAILFTSEAAVYIQERESDPAFEREVSQLKFWFGNLPRTIYSLIQAMLGGVSWGVCSDSLLHLNIVMCGMFIFYVAFTILAVMNVVTGVFVDNAVETARSTRDFMIAKEMELKEKYASEMRDLFIEMDKDGSGTVGLEEINEYLEDPRVQAFFNTLGLDTNDTERLFKLIDDDGSGDVDVGEFLDGCLRLKGQARSLDVYAIMHDLKLVENKVDDLIATMRHQGHQGRLGSTWNKPQGKLQRSNLQDNLEDGGEGGRSRDMLFVDHHNPEPPHIMLEGQAVDISCGQSQAAPDPTFSQNARSSHWASSAQASASRTPHVVTVTTTATATLT